MKKEEYYQCSKCKRIGNNPFRDSIKITAYKRCHYCGSYNIHLLAKKEILKLKITGEL